MGSGFEGGRIGRRGVGEGGDEKKGLVVIFGVYWVCGGKAGTCFVVVGKGVGWVDWENWK